MNFEFGDVILVPFPFTDQTTSKKRPAVVVSSSDYQLHRSDLILIAVTSQSRSSPFYGELVGAWFDKHPAVQLVAVVARPDERWGETPCAFVQLKPGANTSAEEIIAFCREQLAHFKAPKSVVFGALPTTATGKVQKFALRERARSL